MLCMKQVYAWSLPSFMISCCPLLAQEPALPCPQVEQQDANAPLANGETPLTQAVIKNDTEAVKKLLATAGIEVNRANSVGGTPLALAVTLGHTECVKLLMAAPGVELNKPLPNGDTPLHVAINFGHTELLQLLATTPGIDLNCANNNKVTPLLMLSNYNQPEHLRILLAAGADVNQVTSRGDAALFSSAYFGLTDNVKLLLEYGAKLPEGDRVDLNPLSGAIQNDHIEAVRVLLEAGANPNLYTENGTSLLTLSICKDKPYEILELLMKHGADVNYADKEDGMPPLVYAAKMGNLKVVRALLESGAKADIFKDGNSFLISSVRAENANELCSLLIRHGANVNYQDKEQGSTALLYAVLSNNTELLPVLISAGANVNLPNKFDETPLFSAAYHGHTDCLKLLLAAGADVNSPNEFKGITATMAAANKGHVECLKELIAAGGDINARCKEGSNALMYSIMGNHRDCFELLLNTPGIKTDAHKDPKKTVLMCAASEDNPFYLKRLLQIPGINLGSSPYAVHTAVGNNLPENVRLLLAAGMNPDVKESQTATPLHYAALGGFAECMQALLEGGANPNACTAIMETPLYIAAGKGYADCVKLLLKAPGILPEIARTDGNTVLHAAVMDNHAECLRLLLEYPGLNLNARNNDGDTALDIAENNKHTECALLLMEAGTAPSDNRSLLRAAGEANVEELRRLLALAGIDVNAVNEDGYTPLLLALEQQSTECVRLLLAAPGIDVNYEGTKLVPPLVCAAANGNAEHVKMLLEAGANPNSVERLANQQSALLFAAGEGYTECVCLLLNAPGIDVNLANAHGITPLNIAVIKNNTQIVRMLLAVPGIDLEKGPVGMSSLQIAEEENLTEIAELLIAAGAVPNPTELWEAAATGKAEELRRLLAHPRVKINAADSAGNTALLLAANAGHTECVRLLLAAPGTDANHTNTNGETALMNAAYRNHPACVELLAAHHGINPNTANKYGMTPLLAATMRGNTDCVRHLLTIPGIDVNAPNTKGESPLNIATQKGYAELADLLRTAGANGE